MIAATSNLLATPPAAPGLTGASTAAPDPLALALGTTPQPTTTAPGKPAATSSFDAMLAALAPQGADTTAQPGTVKAALGDDTGEDGSSAPTGTGDDLAGDVRADAPLLTALAAGIALPAAQTQTAPTQTASRAPLASGKSAAPILARGADPAQPAGTPDAATPGASAPPAAAASAATPQATTPAFDIEAMFPGLTARLDGVAGVKGARAKPAAAPAAVTGAKDATAAAAPTTAAATPAPNLTTPAKVEAKHAAAPALDAIAAAPVAPPAAPPSAPTHAPGDAAPVTSATPASDGVQTQLTVAQDGAWLDRLARDIAQSADKDAKLRFQLNPEHLGTLKVELANGADGTQVRFTADTETARSLLADQQPRLLAEARARGMRIADARIDLAGQNTQAGQSFQQQGQSGGQRLAWTPLPTTSGSIPQPLAETAAIRAASAERYA